MIEQARAGWSDEPYVVQRARGFRWLRFSPELEREFREEYSLQHSYSHAQLGLCAALLGLLLSVVFNHLLYEYPRALLWFFDLLILGVLTPVVLIGLILASRPRWRRLLPATVVILLLIAIAVTVGLRYGFAHAGVHYPYQTEIFLALALFLLSGLRFWQALLLGLILLAATLATDLILGNALSTAAERFYNVLIACVLAAAGGYSQEYILRMNFLNSRIARYRAIHDVLTGLYNRRGLEERLRQAWRLAQREQKTLAVMLLDLDHFKAYNDSHGHAAGDLALQTVAEALQQSAGQRPMDFTGRWGGEEFLVLWYDIDAGAVERLAESCRLLIECLHPPHGRITASGGCAILQPGLESLPYELIERADAALYRAKQTGRNRIVMAQAPAAGIRWRA